MRLLSFVTVILAGALFLCVSTELPNWADPQSPASTHLSPHFIEKTLDETHVPNIVTAVLGDYRGYDTMFETIVVFCAGMACFFLLGGFHSTEQRKKYYRHKNTGIVLGVKKGAKGPRTGKSFESIDPTWVPYDFIVSRVAKLLIPFIQLYGLYVIAHGHHSPGGGFQGGVILAAGFLLLALSHNLTTLKQRISNKTLSIMSAGGVLIYFGYGCLAMLYGGNFLDYSALAPLLGCDPVWARSHGILVVEIGVGLTVMSTMIVIYNNVVSHGRYDEGL